MEITKSHWESHNGQVTLGVPITKVDRERRIVSGFATLNNLDTQGDIVLSEASRDAFNNFAGNVREMHDKIAAGRVVNFREQMYFDPKTEKVYEGIYVDVYVSKGAQSTWEKVLDGTLTGFSIGGMIPEGGSEQFYDEAIGKYVNIITKYILVELSLVDSPANQLANVFAVQKSADGTQVSGIAVGVETVDVFWCSDDEIAIIGTDTCSNCGDSCEKVGWIERDLPEAEKSLAIAGLLKNTAKPAVQKEEGVIDKMADEIEKTVDETTVVAEVSEVAPVAVEKSDTADEVTAEATTAEVVDASDAAEEEIDWKQELDNLRSTIGQVSEALAGIAKAVEVVSETSTGLAESVKENAAKIEALGESVNKTVSTSIEEKTTEIVSRLGDVEKSLVVKKASDRSANAAGTTEKKDIWADRFTVPRI